VHSTEDLTSASFTITVDDQDATFVDLFPGFDESDRLGVIVRQPCGGLGASTLILATVTAFYDVQRERSDDFFIYPDYFLFHVDRPLGDHNMLDIWPGHKEVVVATDPEEVLRAINDRAITRLLVEDVEPGAPSFERETLASANILTAFAYSSQGRVDDADVSVSGNAATESYASAVLDQSQEIDSAIRDGIRSGRRNLLENGTPIETYRRIGVDEALSKLV
jgi:hypothetical protein